MRLTHWERSISDRPSTADAIHPQQEFTTGMALRVANSSRYGAARMALDVTARGAKIDLVRGTEESSHRH